MNADISSNQSSAGTPALFVAPPARELRELTVGGITPFTSIDFPGRLAAVVYTQGCAWRCRYCHNAHLRPFRSDTVIPFSKVLKFLKNRKGLLDGVVFCGGEPTAQPELPAAMREIKALGFQVALHTAGMYPDRLREALALCDWVGMDVKAPFHAYEKITQVTNSGEVVKQSLRLLLESGVDHEIRTTVHSALLSKAQLLEMAGELSGLGVQNYALQIFQARGCLDEELNGSSVLGEASLDDLEQLLSPFFNSFKIRNN